MLLLYRDYMGIPIYLYIYKIIKMECILKCVKEGSKLRIKIISDGYLNSANCQFPRALRVMGGL